jgi:large subunit ribosomal protein L32e
MNALKLREHIKKKKPDFVKQDHHKRKEIKKRWRRAKGIHSKTRLHKKGRQRGPEIGFRSPVEVRGLTKHGLKEKMIHSANDLKNLDSKLECAVIAGSVGTRNKLEIAKKAEELKIKITNIRKNFLEEVKKKIEERKKKRKEKEKKSKEKKKEPKEKTIEELTDEEKKKTEKAEKDKIITRREQ